MKKARIKVPKTRHLLEVNEEGQFSPTLVALRRESMSRVNSVYMFATTPEQIELTKAYWLKINSADLKLALKENVRSVLETRRVFSDELMMELAPEVFTHLIQGLTSRQLKEWKQELITALSELHKTKPLFDVVTYPEILNEYQKENRYFLPPARLQRVLETWHYTWKREGKNILPILNFDDIKPKLCTQNKSSRKERFELDQIKKEKEAVSRIQVMAQLVGMLNRDASQEGELEKDVMNVALVLKDKQYYLLMILNGEYRIYNPCGFDGNERKLPCDIQVLLMDLRKRYGLQPLEISSNPGYCHHDSYNGEGHSSSACISVLANALLQPEFFQRGRLDFKGCGRLSKYARLFQPEQTYCVYEYEWVAELEKVHSLLCAPDDEFDANKVFEVANIQKPAINRSRADLDKIF